MDLQPHQKKALKELRDGKILWGGVGSGKSRVAVAYYEAEHPHQDVYVITTAKKRDSKDWEGEFAQITVGKEPSATVLGVLCVDSWNNLAKYTDITNAFFIFDEQRLVGSGAWVKAFLKIAKNNNWILLSATPGDTWLDYIPVFVANGFYKNRTEFKREHVIYSSYTKFPKVDRYVGVGKLVKLRNQILIHMRYANQTVRHDMIQQMEHNEELVQSVIKNRWHLFHNRPIRDITEVFAVLRRIINSDPSRLRRVQALLEKHPKLVVFYNFDYELEILRRLEDRTTVAELNGHNHDDIPETDSWVYLVQYIAGSEALNITETNATVFYSLTYSYKMWEQAHGRTDRMNTPFTDLYYYIFKSKSGVDQAIWRSLRAKKNFQPTRFPIESLRS